MKLRVMICWMVLVLSLASASASASSRNKKTGIKRANAKEAEESDLIISNITSDTVASGIDQFFTHLTASTISPDFVQSIYDSKAVSFAQEILLGAVIFVLQMALTLFLILGFLLLLYPDLSSLTSSYYSITPPAPIDIVHRSPVRFADVLGCDEIRQELLQILDVMKNPERYKRFGVKTPRGVLLKGPPGTGKTLIAKALAGESGIPLLLTSGSAFEESLVGVGAARVREIFSTARNKFNQSIIFIDEIDGIAGKRDLASSHPLTLNQLLVEMDGFNPSKTFVLAATNAYKDLDPAILRPGRFDRILTLNLPDAKGRGQILMHYLRDVQSLLSRSVNLTTLAAETIGFSGAELAQVVNQAKMIAAATDSEFLEGHHFDQALRLTRFGPKRAVLMSFKDKERIALHEAGHAVVALLTPGAMPVQSATIIPHASSLGMVVSVPGEADALLDSFHTLTARIDVSLAGWLAEELALGPQHVSTGSAHDLETANSLARHLVNNGFGAQTGFFKAPPEQLGTFSEEAKRRFEGDVEGILRVSRERVKRLLRRREGAWRGIAGALMKQETLSGAEMQAIIDCH